MRHPLRTMVFSSVLCLGLASGPALLAQDTTGTSPDGSNQAGQRGNWHGPMSPDQELSHLTKALNLSSDQQTQIKPILEDRHDQLMQLHQDSSLSRQDRMSKMKSLDETSNSKLEAVLNDQQKTKYDKMVADRKARMQAMRENRGNDAAAQPQ